MIAPTYTPVGDLPAGTHFRDSREFSTKSFVVVQQVEDYTRIRIIRRRDSLGDGSTRLLHSNTMVWPLSDFAHSPTD